MNWKKLGKIFDPRDFELANNCVEFAQSPQVLIKEDRIRVYFSTRETESTGMFLSHISYVDFTRDFSKILNVSSSQVIELGELGTFDEHGIFPISPFVNNDEVWAYTCGWSRRKSVSVETSIGLVKSHDGGDTFEREGLGPIISSSLHQPMLVGDGLVKKFGDDYHMWYMYGVRWIDQLKESPARVYKIGYAKSKNGEDWVVENRQIIPDVLNEDECQALPSVVYFNGKYHMVFCYREAVGFRKDRNKGYKLGYAYSDNLKDWIRNDDFLDLEMNIGEWDGDMMCYPHFFILDNNMYLLYNGNSFGRYGFGLAIFTN